MRRIRLTEEQLHHVIRESVSQILNEIDWKTYDNASRKKSLKLLDMGIPYIKAVCVAELIHEWNKTVHV